MAVKCFYSDLEGKVRELFSVDMGSPILTVRDIPSIMVCDSMAIGVEVELSERYGEGHGLREAGVRD